MGAFRSAADAIRGEIEIHNCQSSLSRVQAAANRVVDRLQGGQFIPVQTAEAKYASLRGDLVSGYSRAAAHCSTLPADAALHRPGVAPSLDERDRR